MIDYPEEFGEGGQRLWRALLDRDEELGDELNPNMSVAIEACRSQDKCDKLLKICADEEVMIDNGRGQPVTHPAWVESRQQANVLKQLIAALRLPDEATGKRPKNRPGPVSGRVPGGSARVSSLDRARQAKSTG